MRMYKTTDRLIEHVIYDLLSRVKPWNAETAKKQIESFVRKVTYTTIAKWTQGKTENYMPVDVFIGVLGKKMTLSRLKRGIEISDKVNEFARKEWNKNGWEHY